MVWQLVLVSLPGPKNCKRRELEQRSGLLWCGCTQDRGRSRRLQLQARRIVRKRVAHHVELLEALARAVRDLGRQVGQLVVRQLEPPETFQVVDVDRQHCNLVVAEDQRLQRLHPE